jgi:hypothetical protein
MSLPVHITSGRLAIVPVPARFTTFAMHVLPVLVFAAMLAGMSRQERTSTPDAAVRGC